MSKVLSFPITKKLVGAMACTGAQLVVRRGSGVHNTTFCQLGQNSSATACIWNGTFVKRVPEHSSL